MDCFQYSPQEILKAIRTGVVWDWERDQIRAENMVCEVQAVGIFINCSMEFISTGFVGVYILVLVATVSLGIFLVHPV